MTAPEIIACIIVWVGHACIWTTLLNVVYSQPWPKRYLKPWRLFTGGVIGGFPAVLVFEFHGGVSLGWDIYFRICLVLGGIVFPAITISRLLRPRPACVLEVRTETLDLWKTLGPSVRGDGKWNCVTRLPGNCVFQVDVTELTLKPPKLPANLDGLSILLLSDLHFHGTPSKVWFDAILDRLLQFPKPDVVVLAGDYVDTDTHSEWIAPILGRLQWNDIGVAILGNHDAYHHPERTRQELEKLTADGTHVSPTRERGSEPPSLARRANMIVLGDQSCEVTICGERCIFTGNEAPWFPAPTAVPDGGFRICVSHSPDQFRWAQLHGFDLILCGHVHGGQIRVPGIGSIFVPSLYGRRYDMGVFEKGGTVMVVGRGVSGKEPLRFRCHPQVIRMVLRVPSSPQRGRLT